MVHGWSSPGYHSREASLRVVTPSAGLWSDASWSGRIAKRFPSKRLLAAEAAADRVGPARPAARGKPLAASVRAGVPVVLQRDS